MLKWLRNYCWTCGNKGFVVERGERIPRAELTPAQIADELVQGGGHYRAVEKPCPKCRKDVREA